MASPPSVFTVSVAFTLLVSFPSSHPEVADCGTQLLMLAPCAPFVQRATPAPAMSCCDNLNGMVMQHAECLCFFLNKTSSLAVNRTLVLRLPELCNLKADPASCPGLLNLTPVPAATPASQFVPAPTENSSMLAPPLVGLLPRSSSVGVSSGRVVVAAAGPLLISIFMACFVFW